LKARCATISFVGTENLIAELGADAAGMVISQVVPPPDSDDFEIAKQYREALKSQPDLTPSFVSFEGYISARVLLAGLEKAGRDLTREKLVDAIDGLSKFDLGGLPISFSATNHQGSNSVFLTIVKDGKAQLVR
jgi:branched-chain amino acid transport system substrate-binding protein